MFEVFGFPIRLYGLIVASAIYIGITVISKIFESRNLDPEYIWDGFVWALIPGIIGARLYHVVDLWSYYFQHPSEIIAVWNGGIGIFGAVLGGFLGICVYWFVKLKMTKVTLPMLLDATVFGMPIGQAIGRWGNYFNQELYGSPTNVPWALTIDPVYRIDGFETISKYHPLFLYESLLNLGLFGLMYLLFRKNLLKLGQLQFGAVYLIGYGLIRFMLESVRLEKWTIGSGIPMAQIVSGLMIGIGILILINSKYKTTLLLKNAGEK